MLLSKFRSGAKSGIAKLLMSFILISAVGGLVLMDIGGFFTGGGTGQNTVAKVGRSAISTASFDNTVRTTLAQQGLEPEVAYQLGLINQILQSEIGGRLLYKTAGDLNIQVGRDTVAKQISTLVEPYVTPELSKKQALQRILQNQGMTEGQFIQAMRTEMTNNLVRNAVAGAAAFTTPQEARDLYRYQQEERTIKALVMPNSAVKDYKEPVDEILMTFYQAGKERYAIPETRSFSIARLTQDDLKDSAQISDEELKAAYEDDLASYAMPERRVMEQAVLSSQDAAEKAASAAKEGKSLKDAVKAATENTDAYLGRETFQKTGLPEEIGNAAFAAAANDVVGPVQTALGWHVLVINEILQPETKNFESVKEELRKDLLHTKLADQLYNLSGAIDDELAGGASLQDVAESQHLALKKYGPVLADGSTPDKTEGFKDHESDRLRILQTVFELGEGESSPVMELADGSFIAVQVDAINEKSYKPYEDVKAELKNLWIEDQRAVLNRQKAQDFVRILANKEKNLAQLASENGLEVRTFSLKRNADPAAPVTQSAKMEFFAMEKNVPGMVQLEDSFVVGEVTAIEMPDASKISEKELEENFRAGKTQAQQETFLAYMQHLQAANDVKINQRVLQQMYAPGNEGQ